jgi:DNA-binding NarL/FixJ family response regulator
MFDLPGERISAGTPAGRSAWVTGDCCGGDAPAEIRVLIVDDHPEVRRALAEVLSDEDDLTVVGECEDGSQVVEAAERLRPDIVFMDLSMPVMGGCAAAEALRAVRSTARVIMLTGEGPEARSQAGVAGARALVPKGTRLGPLLRCLRTVAADGSGCPYCL